MRYTLADHQTTTLAEMGSEPGQERYVYSPLIPSPEGTHVAFTVNDRPGEDRQVADPDAPEREQPVETAPPVLSARAVDVRECSNAAVFRFR